MVKLGVEPKARNVLHDGGLKMHSNAAEVVLPVVSRGRSVEFMVVVLGKPKAERGGSGRVLFFEAERMRTACCGMRG